MRSSTVLPLHLLVSSLVFTTVNARAVFAHYLVGNILDQDAQTDIQNAMSMGLDAFALNVANPSASYVAPALASLFNHAKSSGFKLFLSMDLAAKGGGPLSDYGYIIDTYANGGAWFAGENGKPLVSTFSAANYQASDIQAFRDAYDVYFMPDFDNTEGYYTAADGWWNYWGGLVDGLFSWESTWPQVGATNDGDVSLDVTVLNGAVAHSKSYMIGLSLLQYKDAYGTNLYRRGEQNLPIRMANILAMNPAPLYVEIITWNDGPGKEPLLFGIPCNQNTNTIAWTEGHYIGSLWTEQNSDAQPATYASQRGAPHTGIQPLLTEFINSFRNQQTSFQPSAKPVGAIWYKTILQSTTCPDNNLGGFYSPPNGASVGLDNINWAVVLPSNGASYTIQFVSNGGAVGGIITGKPGFQHGAVPLSVNAQYMKIVNSAGVTEYSTGLGRCVSSQCFDDIYNYNPQVLGLEQGDHATVGCWQMTQQARASSNGATTGPFYPSSLG